MKVTKNIILDEKGLKPILVDLFYKDSTIKMPLIIFCHGYKGFKDWGAWDLVAKEFAKNDFFFLKFNFSHNGGTVDDPIDFPDLEAFGNNNFSHELNDIERVIDFTFSKNSVCEKIDKSKVFLIGHSRGGGICTIKCSENKNITGLLSWAGVSNFKKRFSEGSEEFIEWQKKGVKYIQNGRTKQLMPHFFQFYLDFKKNENKYNIKSAVSKLNIPYLIIHGDNDKAVDVNEAFDLASWNKKNKLHIVNGAGHTFGSKHPWESDKLPDELHQVVYKSIEFISQNLNVY